MNHPKQKFKKSLQKWNFFYKVSNTFSKNKIKVKPKSNLSFCKFVSIKKCDIRSYSKSSKIFIDKHAVLHNVTITIIGENNVVRIGSGVEITKSEIVVSGENCLIEIGNQCSIHEAKIYCGDSGNFLKIGKNCLIGFGTTIMTSDAHMIVDKNAKRLNEPGNIEIQDHVWLASNSTILGGSIINSNSVGGANVFIKKQTIPSNCVFVEKGRIIKKETNWIR